MDDWADWAEYVRQDLAAFREAEGWGAQVWMSTPGAARAVARLGRSARGDDERAAYVGPWHAVRPHVTREFRQWIEESRATERVTLSEWRARAKVAREDAAREESAGAVLDDLHKLATLQRERDHLIRQAAARGASKVEIAQVLGISRSQVHRIVAEGEAAPVVSLDDYRADSWDDGWDAAAAF